MIIYRHKRWRYCININTKLFQEFPLKLMKGLKANKMLCFEWFECLTRSKCWVLNLCVPKTFGYFTENYCHNFMSSFMVINGSYNMSHISNQFWEYFFLDVRVRAYRTAKSMMPKFWMYFRRTFPKCDVAIL